MFPHVTPYEGHFFLHTSGKGHDAISGIRSLLGTRKLFNIQYLLWIIMILIIITIIMILIILGIVMIILHFLKLHT